MTDQQPQSVALSLAKWLSVLILLLCAFIINRKVEFSSRCLSSSLVDSIVFFSEEYSLSNCLKEEWLSDTKSSDLRLNGLMRWTGELDKLKQFLPGAKSWLQVIVVSENPFLFSAGRNHSLVGGLLRSSKNHWQTALVQSWLLQASGQLSPFERDVLGDFLVALANGKFAVAAIDGSPEIGEAKVAIGYFSESVDDYCLSPYRHPRDLETCENQATQVWRPLLARGLFRLYQDANFAERRRLRYWLTQEILLGGEKLIVDGIPSAQWAKAQIDRWSRRIFSGEKQARTLKALENDLGFIRSEKPTVAVSLSALPERTPLSSPVLAFFNGDWFWWDGIALRMAHAPKGAPVHMVSVTCNELETAVDSLGGSSALIVETCDPKALVGWDLLARNDIAAFISANPTVNLLWLNSKAFKKLGTKVTEAGRLRLKRIRKLTYWQEDHWDSRLQLFRPRAAIDLVLGHRASRNML